MVPAESDIRIVHSQPRKILFLCYRFPYPLIGGDRIKSYHLLRHLSSFAEVDLITLDEWSSSDQDSISHLKTFLHSVTVIPFDKYSAASRIVKSLPTHTPIEIAWYSNPVMQQAVNAAISNTSYDLLACFFLRTAPYISNVQGIPKILIAEDSRLLADERASQLFSPTPEYFVRRIDAMKLRRYEATMMKKFSVTTFVAHPDEERVKAVDPALRTAILTNGVDLETFTFSTAGREDAILFAGHLRIFHNVEMAKKLLQTIYPSIRAIRPTTKLWIVGKAPDSSLQKLIAETEGAELFADVKEIQSFYQRASVFIHPQFVGAGIQNKLLEAMACGCPIITTHIGASGIDGIVNGVHVMVSETDEEFVNNGLHLLSDNDERLWLAKNSRDLVERKYSWQNVFTSFDQIIEGIVPNLFPIHPSFQEVIT